MAVIQRGVRKRRVVVFSSALAIVTTIAMVWALTAGASVSNPGPVTITATGGTLVTPLGSLGPIDGTLSDTVDAAGTITIPESGISFAPFTTTASGFTVDVTIVPNGGMTGSIDPTTGLVTLSGSITTSLAISSLGITGCPLGPVAVNLSTANTGGVPYSTSTGAATLVDNTMTIPVIATGAPGCAGLEAVINSTLGLPTAPGAVVLTLPVTFSPIVTSATSSTTGATTSTTGATTSTTGATTSTTAATTTTTRPTTTTTAAPTTTTTQPTTTTTSASSSTTSTSMPSTTTTSVPQNCKPGHGYGDKNHCHFGPPPFFGGFFMHFLHHFFGMFFGWGMRW